LKFQPGELAKITKLDLKRSRLDVFLELDEPLLIPYPEGPFELYREARCRAELMVEVPRPTVKKKDLEGTEALVLQVMERHATRDEATASEAWNQREMDPYPEDYQETLAALEVWRVEQQNARIRARIQEAREEVRRILNRVSTEKEGYAAGFALGIESMMSREFGDCDRLVGTTFKNYKEAAPNEFVEEGFHDGQLLAYSLEMMERLEECYVDVP
jgi:hypothetical protein